MINRKLKAKNIISNIEDVFPISLAEDWDKVGIQFGDDKKVVENIVIAMDLTKEVMDKAIETKVDMIILYHPFLFHEQDFVLGKTEYEYKNKIISRLKNFKIVVYVLHTAFDKEPKGMPLAIKRIFGEKYKSWPITGLKNGVIFNWENNIVALNERFQQKFGIKFSATNIKSQVQTIQNFALLNGSAPFEDLFLAWNQNEVDLVVTSDLKWSAKIALNEEGISYLEISHIIEKVFVNHIANFLKKSFTSISIIECEAKEINKNNF